MWPGLIGGGWIGGLVCRLAFVEVGHSGPRGRRVESDPWELERAGAGDPHFPSWQAYDEQGDTRS